MNIELTKEELQLVLDGLGQLPHYAVRSLIDNLHNQGNEQIAELNAQSALAGQEINSNNKKAK